MDWKKLLKELETAGYTQARIASHCGVAQSTVSDLARGASREPGFAFGSRLMELRDAQGLNSALEANPVVTQPTEAQA